MSTAFYSYRSATFSRRGSDLKYIIVRQGSQELFSAGLPPSFNDLGN
ncbi:hypothetical protein BRO54_0727 [Geobacillus proteiniphilus]|uniref:Uncharacterized protein n=1 Tax=Geobacillus proteiniphilus TaxID=860353 RepID=A0A1Q5T669_9BACL|nr:hypothetical protein BRO54_0727 [Geobacillus proteiniphilus]